MRINVNLATQPFEDAQEFLRRSLTLLITLTVLTVGLVWYTVHSYYRARGLNRQIATVQNEIRELNREAQQARNLIARPENRGTVQRSEFLNSVFARKAFSWTTVFSDMEKIMPYGLSVVSIRPQLTANNELSVEIVVAGDSRDRTVELVRSMETLPRFRDVSLLLESVPDPATRTAGSEGRVQYTVTAVYQPRLPEPSAASGEQKEGSEPAHKQTADLESRP